MESDLIKRSELREILEMRNMIELYPEWRTLSLGMKEKIRRLAEAYRRALDDTPTVDAVPVVRCEDCIYGKPNWLEGEEDGPPYCVVCKKHGSGLTTADFFCAFGEKREDAEEDG